MADRNHDGWEDNEYDFDGDGEEDEEPGDIVGGPTDPNDPGYAEYQAWLDERRAASERNNAEATDLYNSERGPGGRANAAEADARARWDAMSWEERQAARGRGESDPYSDGGGYGGGGSGGGGYGGGYGEFDAVSADIPIWGDLSGARARNARSAAEIERRRRAGVLGDLAEFMPSEDNLSVEYGNEDLIRDTTAEGALARDNWTDWAEGGLTDADRGMMEDARRASGRSARAGREADLSALDARGMGGSGAALASMLSAGEGAADRNASMDATMMGAAQQRQVAATDSLGDWAAGETAYGREREGRNTDRENRTRESASEAAQQAHENRQAHAGMSIGMNPYGGADPNAEEDEADEAAGGLFSFLGDIF